MIANIGSRLIEVGSGHLVMEATFSADAHGFPTSRGTIIHGGAIATLADESLASVAFTLAEPGETTTCARASRANWSPPRPSGTAHDASPSARPGSSRTAAPWSPKRAP
jgi:acyl-coenzyme A thioesterase PaaI-like protein